MRASGTSLCLRIDRLARRRWVRVVLVLVVVTTLAAYLFTFTFRRSVGFADSNYRLEVFVGMGALFVNVYPDGFLQNQWDIARRSQSTATVNPLSWWKPGFNLVQVPPGTVFRLDMHHPDPGVWTIQLPLYLFLLVAGAPLLYPHLPFVLRARRRAQGLCASCGYDLRGSTGGMCSECGVVVHGDYPPRISD
jgi:hypothetical protein